VQNGATIIHQWLCEEANQYTLTPIGQMQLGRLSGTQGKLALEEAPLVLPDLAPGIEEKLLDYQVTPAKQLLRALQEGRKEWGYAGAVDLSDVGTGKTYMDLAAAISFGREIIILCPTVGEEGWRRACKHFGIEPRFITTYEAVRGNWRHHICEERQGTFIWKDADRILLILDEAHALRHDDTLTVRCCAGAVTQGIPIIVASATIALSPIEMRFAGRVTGLHKGGEDWTRFLAQHGCAKTRTGWKWDGRIHHLQAINAKLFPRRGARVTKEDLGDKCPETIITTLALEVEQGAEIEQRWAELEALVARVRAQDGDRAADVLEQRSRMAIWQELEMALVEPIAKRVKQDVREGRSVALFMNFNRSRIAMSKALNTTAGFYGGQNKVKRAWFEKEFQANRIHVLVNNLGAGGASVSLHDIHGERPRRAYIFMSDDVVKVAQCLGRVDRVNGQSVSEQLLCCVKGGHTEEMVKRTRQKMGRLSALNNGDPRKAERF
jgi:hypothetical protein